MAHATASGPTYSPVVTVRRGGGPDDQMATSSVLWQNDRKTVILLDLVRSIEEAQIPSSELAANNGRPPVTLRRLVSALPPASPFPTPEPKRGSSEPPTTSPSAQIADLMTQAAVESALEEIRASHEGPWCLPRVTSPKQKPTEEAAQAPAAGPTTTDSPSLSPPQPRPPPSSTDGDTPPAPFDHRLYHLPPNSHPLLGTIPIPTSTTSTPGGSRPIPSAAAAAAADLPSDLRFDLILLDPPWPNRSAKRKRKRAGAGAYRPAPDLSSVRALLRQVPVASRLSPGGLVAVWVTNAARSADLLLGTGGGGDRGLFSEWGVEPVGEWTWLKITAGGEPVVPVGSAWRKPWERLLIARKRTAAGEGGSRTGPVEGKVIAAVPDVHSRKPNLRGLFEELLPERYEALEVFARNLTAGWWAWGDEVLLFQRRECWVEGEWG
ncbi:MT-A70-domain-containing protein [Thermothelomyces heterothallicus CBS 202.75]|uniref:MT-A70-domain-containing protein n=1 Tax=Thermothelomyces heterothallicus CBS 202.75 TaxID=1149848 RepID=UPI003743D534